jgi:hypothetical protein
MIWPLYWCLRDLNLRGAVGGVFHKAISAAEHINQSAIAVEGPVDQWRGQRHKLPLEIMRNAGIRGGYLSCPNFLNSDCNNKYYV